MLVPLRLGLRRLRLELLILMGASVVLCLVAAVVAVAIAHDNEVLRSCTTGDDCSATIHDLDGMLSWVSYLRVALVSLPVLAGAMIGTSLVASEVEQGTAAFVWAVIPKRRTWLRDVSITGLVALLLVSVPIAVASAALSAALGTTADSTYAPSGIDMAPVLLVVRGCLTFSIAVLVGIVVGRTLSALILSSLLSLLCLIVLEVAFATWRDHAVEPIDVSAPGAYYASDGAIAGDGRVVSISEALSTAQAKGKSPDELYRFVQLGLTPWSRASMLAADAGVVIVVSATGLLATGVLAVRRSPV